MLVLATTNVKTLRRGIDHMLPSHKVEASKTDKIREFPYARRSNNMKLFPYK